MTKHQDQLSWQVHNIEAEQSLIGGVLLNNDAFPLAAKHITAEHFFEPIHQSIWGIVESLIGAGKRADPIIVPIFLPKAEITPNVTTKQYLARLAAEATTILNVPDYARIVRELADRRRLTEIAQGLMPVDGTHPASIAVEAISALDSLVAAASDNASPSLDMRQATERAIDAVAHAYQNEGKVLGIPTTLRDLDRKLGGMSRGDLVILAGRPGMGKSAMILTMLRRAAEQGYKSLFTSLEMNDVSLTQRMISDVIFDAPGENLAYSFLRSGRFHERLFEKVQDAGRWLATLPIRIEQQGGMTMSQIAARARQIKRKDGLDILAIDHLDLVRPSGRYSGNKVYELGEITAAAKVLAKELDIVVVLLCQLSREVEKREDKRPQLSDLRSSGSIEQDADTVIFLFRKSYYLANSEPEHGTEDHLKWEAEVAANQFALQAIVAKQRMGPTGPVDLFCDIANNAVRDLEKQQ